MPALLYSVRTTCQSITQRGRYLAWLAPDHLLAVQAGGAGAIRVVLPEVENPAGPALVEVQYEFPSRKAFDAYVRDHAPALRADALKHFPPESGITFTRQLAEIACELE